MADYKVPCDGYASDLGCDKMCEPAEWKGRWGGKNLCAQCQKRFEADNKNWAWLTR